jgi:hypothetical protein
MQQNASFVSEKSIMMKKVQRGGGLSRGLNLVIQHIFLDILILFYGN